MKIYTKSGDKGETSLVYGTRVPKNNPRVEAYGTCDEANSLIGLGKSYLDKDARWDALKKSLHIVQTKLFHIGAELATPEDRQVSWPITSEDVQFLEREIDRMDPELPPLTNFILPGGHPTASALHVARTVVRRAERVALDIPEQINPTTFQYLNRLSDYLFVAARWVNKEVQMTEEVLHSDEH